MRIHDIKQALQGYYGDINERIHYSEWIRRMGPHWLQDYVNEHDYVVSQLRRIEETLIPGLGAAIATETMKQIGGDRDVTGRGTSYVERRSGTSRTEAERGGTI